MHNASSYGHLDIAALLLKFNAVVNATDKWGFTPLHEGTTIILSLRKIYSWNCLYFSLFSAAQKGRTQLCALLLAHGADPFMKNQENQSPIELSTAEDVKSLLQDAMTVSINNKCTNQTSSYNGNLNTLTQHQQSTLVSPTTETVTLPTGASITLSVPVFHTPSRSCPAQGAEMRTDIINIESNEAEALTNVAGLLMR